MNKRNRHVSGMEEPDLDGFERIGAAFELPAADEFACTYDDVREACTALEGIRESLAD